MKKQILRVNLVQLVYTSEVAQDFIEQCICPSSDLQIYEPKSIGEGNFELWHIETHNPGCLSSFKFRGNVKEEKKF